MEQKTTQCIPCATPTTLSSHPTQSTYNTSRSTSEHRPPNPFTRHVSGTPGAYIQAHAIIQEQSPCSSWGPCGIPGYRSATQEAA